MLLNYFAFGSNLASHRLLQRIPAASVYCVATLSEHRLCWRKNGADRSGKCDIEHTRDPEHLVYGVVYRMTHADKLELDVYEGAGYGYDHKTVELLTLEGDLLEAFTYYALDIDHSQQPYHWYKEHVLRGALEHGLPPHYVEQIRSTPSMHDQDAERHRRELSIYSDDL